jgi:hypothetical protein
VNAEEILSAGERERFGFAENKWGLAWAPPQIEGERVAEVLLKLASLYFWLPITDILVLSSAPYRDGLIAIFKPLSKKNAFYSVAFFSTGINRWKTHIGAFWRPADAVEDIERLTGVRLARKAEPSAA